jgi:hypothetical protein
MCGSVEDGEQKRAGYQRHSRGERQSAAVLRARRCFDDGIVDRLQRRLIEVTLVV